MDEEELIELGDIKIDCKEFGIGWMRGLNESTEFNAAQISNFNNLWNTDTKLGSYLLTF